MAYQSRSFSFKGHPPLADSEVILDVSADISGLESGMDKANKSTGGFLSNITGMINPLTLAATAITGIGAAAVATWSDFDAGSDSILALTGASGPALDSMSQSIINLRGTSAGLGTDMETMGTVIGTVSTRTGLTGQALEDLSGQVLNMSRITGQDGVGAVEDLTRVMGAWQVPMDQSSGLMDKMFKAGQTFGIGMDDLTGSLTKFGPTLQDMGFSMDESIAMLGSFEKGGVNADVVMAGLKKSVGAFAKENIPLAQGLEDVTQKILHASSQTDALNIAAGVFGTKAAPDMVAAIQSGNFEFGEAVKAIQGAGGAIDDVSERQMDFGDRWQVAWNKASTALIPVGQGLMDLADKGLSLVLSGVDEVGKSFSNFTDPATGAVDIMAALSDVLYKLHLDILGDGLQVIQTGFENVMPYVQSFIDILGTIKDYLLETVLSGDSMNDFLSSLPEPLQALIQPIGDVILKFQEFLPVIQGALDSVWGVVQSVWGQVVAFFQENGQGILDAAVGWAGQAYEMISERVNAVWGIISSIWGIISGFFAESGPGMIEQATGWAQQIGPIIGTIMSTMQTLIMTVFGFIQQFLNEHGTEIQNILKMAWDTIAVIINGALTVIQGVIIPIFQAIVTFITEHGDTIMQVIDGAWTVISTVITTVMGVIQGVINTIMAVINGDWAAAWEAIKGIGQTVWDGITTLISGAWTAISGLLQLGLDALKGIWDTVWGAVSTTLNTIWTDMQTNLSNIWAAVQLLISDGLDAVKTKWEEIWNGVGTFLSDTWTAISTAVTNAVTGVGTALGDLWTNITTWIGTTATNILNSVGTIGGNIIEGIKTGISNGWDAFVSWVQGLLSGLLDGVLAFFGIKSPSTVMRDQVGVQLVAGMKEGWSLKWDDFSGTVNRNIKKLCDDDILAPINALVADGGPVSAAIKKLCDADGIVQKPLKQLTDADVPAIMHRLTDADGVIAGPIKALTDADGPVAAAMKVLCDADGPIQSPITKLCNEDMPALLQGATASLKTGGAGLGQAIADGFSEAFSGAAANMMQLVSSVFDGLWGEASKRAKEIYDLMNYGTAGSGDGYAGGSPANGGTGGGGPTPMASGGIVTRPTFALVGEAGPEAVIPLSQLGRSGGGSTLNLYLDGVLMSAEELSQKLSVRVRLTEALT